MFELDRSNVIILHVFIDFSLKVYKIILCFVGVAEHLRNRDRIFQGPSEPPDELPATSAEHRQVRIVYTKTLMKAEPGSVWLFCNRNLDRSDFVHFLNNKSGLSTFNIFACHWICFHHLAVSILSFPPDWAAQTWLWFWATLRRSVPSSRCSSNHWRSVPSKSLPAHTADRSSSLTVW